MGQFRIEINAVGGHGDLRELGDGAALSADQYPEGSLDKLTFDFVEQLRKHAGGVSIESATLTHWPGQPSEVVDDVLNGVRHGSF